MADEAGTTPTPTPTPAPAPSPAPAGAAPSPTPAPTPTPTPEATPAPAAATWRDGITDPKLKEQAARFNSLDDILRGNNELRGKLGSAIVKPGEKATDEEKAAYRKAMGVPDAPEGYKFPDLPAGMELTDTVKADRVEWAKFLHDENVSAASAERLFAKFVEKGVAADKAQADADKQYVADKDAALRKKWGPEYDINVKHSQFGITKMANDAGINIDELKHIEMKDGKFLFDHPLMWQLMAKVGREAREGDGGGGAMTDSERDNLQSQIRTLRQQQEQAEQARDSRLKNELYQKEMALIAKRDGNRSIVGAGRAA